MPCAWHIGCALVFIFGKDLMTDFIQRRAVTIAMASALLASGATVSAAITPTTTTVQHARGTATVALAPQRVVVYDLAALDAMQALQLPVTGVPKVAYPQYLSGYTDKRYQVAGTLFEPDYEALSRIQPDLIIIAGRSAAKYDTLSKLAPVLDLSVRGDALLADMERNVHTLATLWGKQEAGRQLMEKVRNEVAATRAVAEKSAPALLVLAVNNFMGGQTPGARFGLLHDVLGVPAALPADPSKPRGVPLKMEDIARIDPQWIFVIDRNAATGTSTTKDGAPVIPATELFNNEIIRNTAAGKQGRVVFVDPKIWYLLGSAGPLSMIGNAVQIREALQHKP